MSNATNVSSKSILARLLADEDLNVIHDAKAPTAAFDLKTRQLILPVWENMSASLYDMLVGHEVAHALYTPSDRWQADIQAIADDYGLPYATVQQYVNVVEDARIERMIKAKFPGLRRDFLSAYVDLMGRDLFDLQGRSISDLALIDRLNLEFKVGLHAGQQIPFDAAESVWVDRIRKADSWSDVLDIVADLLRDIIDNGQDEPQASDDAGDTESSEDGQGESGESSASGDESDDESDEEQGQGAAEGSDESDDESSDSASSSDSDGDGAAEGETRSESSKSVPQSITEEAFSKVQDALRDDSSYDHDVRNEVIPPLALDRVIVPFDRIHRDLSAAWQGSPVKAEVDADARTFIARSKPVVNVLAKAFEMKKAADAHKRVQISKSGVLDTVKMMNYRWSEDVFRKTATVRDGKNHGIVMFLDWSGSMSTNITETMEQLIQLVLFCKKVNIPFEVYAFSSVNPQAFGASAGAFDGDTDGLGVFSRDFTLLNLLSSKMNRQQFDVALLNTYALAVSQDYDAKRYLISPRHYGLGSTPLHEAMLAACEIVPAFQKANRVQVVNTVFLTDGAGNGWYLPRKGSVTLHGERLPRRIEGRSAEVFFASLLREKTGSNLVNFFLAPWSPSRFDSCAYSYFNNDKELIAGLETWKKENYAISTSDRQGWDEQYLIRIRKVDNADISLIDDKATAARKKNAFLKSLSAKMTSRVVLNRFIDMIA